MTMTFNTAPSTFPSPWAARAFAIVNAVAEAGMFNLSDFQQALIAAIKDRESSGGCIGDETAYYDCWIAAMSALIEAKGVPHEKLALLEATIRDRFAARHVGHDHHHHGEDDDHEDLPQPIYIEEPQ